ncbi:hypothetical protein BGP77_01120 [Saccharospirillum sp. MSK14-1]|uniref:hypothetical protein n=1 Tax=Saccharospirillum sp. MSK14-1 TaxID=1897632 RepID=UPI000D333551|nr:hypothetical protein [Saccharospirillum sp. MSK14-1]PTY35958.1 hypothetical protein BGP77_01120 [Saccharospirillum sp. MSK14-1]
MFDHRTWQRFRHFSSLFALLWLALGALALTTAELVDTAHAATEAWHMLVRPSALIIGAAGIALGLWGARLVLLTRTGGCLLMLAGLLLLLMPVQIAALFFVFSATSGLTAAILALCISLEWPGLASWLSTLVTVRWGHSRPS